MVPPVAVRPVRERGEGGAGGGAEGTGRAVETGVDSRRPATARAWLREAVQEAATGWPEDVVEEVLLLLTEVLAADGDRSAAATARLRLLPGGRGVELLLPAPLPDSAGPRLAMARAVAARATVHTAGRWVRITTRRGRAPA